MSALMKKRILISCVMSVVMTAMLMGLTFLFVSAFHTVPFSITMSGGDCVEHIGILCTLTEVYAISPLGEVGVPYHFSWNPVGCCVAVVLLAIMCYVSQVLVAKRRGVK